jgi:hypothetical protein
MGRSCGEDTIEDIKKITTEHKYLQFILKSMKKDFDDFE